MRWRSAPSPWIREGSTELSSWVRTWGIEQVHACLEATGEYGAALALSLYESGHLVCIVYPACTAAYAKSRLARSKTDKADAALIAHFCSLNSRLSGHFPALISASCRYWCSGWRCCRGWCSKRRIVATAASTPMLYKPPLPQRLPSCRQRWRRQSAWSSSSWSDPLS